MCNTNQAIYIMLHNKTVISVFSLSVEKKIGKKGVSLDYVILTKSITRCNIVLVINMMLCSITLAPNKDLGYPVRTGSIEHDCVANNIIQRSIYCI